MILEAFSNLNDSMLFPSAVSLAGSAEVPRCSRIPQRSFQGKNTGTGRVQKAPLHQAAPRAWQIPKEDAISRFFP